MWKKDLGGSSVEAGACIGTLVPRARRWGEFGPGSAVRKEADGLLYIRRQSCQGSAEPTWGLRTRESRLLLGCFL